MSNGSSDNGRRRAVGRPRLVALGDPRPSEARSGVTELAADIGVHKSTAFRLLGALEEHELVEQAHERGKYRLGFGSVRLASAVTGRLDVTQSRAAKSANDSPPRLGETVNIAVLRSHYAVNVDQARGPSAVGTHDWVGEFTPLHATSSGKVLLAVHVVGGPARTARGGRPHPIHRAHDHLDRGPGSIELDAIARDGYVVSIEELEHGLNAVAAPIRDHRRRGRSPH